jgi:tyrosyl-tRNA synthetase
MILQAYDFLELSRRYDCRLQMGGSDQWGNIVNGIELGRRIDATELYGVTTPLITKADGSKMGKSVSGAIWLHEDQLSHYDYWQFWRNTDDRDVGRFMRLFTDLPLAEISRLEQLEGSEINAAKIALANAATALCRSEEAAIAAAETARKTFEEGSLGDDLPSLSVSGSIAAIDALVALGFVSSKGEGKRKFAEGAVKLNGETLSSPEALIIVEADVKISLGKKRHGILTPES